MEKINKFLMIVFHLPSTISILFILVFICLKMVFDGSITKRSFEETQVIIYKKVEYYHPYRWYIDSIFWLIIAYFSLK